jgi:hypothetical protein
MDHPECLAADGSDDPQDDRRFVCSFCPETLLGEYSSRRHVEKEHREELGKSAWEMSDEEREQRVILFCLYCSETFMSHHLLYIHQHARHSGHKGKEKAGELSLMCQLCSATFVNDELLRGHVLG